MKDYVTVLGLALLPALGNFSGGLFAEYLRTSKRNLNRALHAASGIVIAIVAVELVPRALEATSGWIVAIAFGVGGLAYVALEALVERLQKKRSGDEGRTGMWMIYIAVAVDLFSDGLMIGAGSAVATSLALVLALGQVLGQVLADVPEGFATIANFKDKDVPRGRRLILGASFAVPVLVAATLAYVLLRGRGEALQMAALVFTAGLLTVAAVEDMIVEAHESAEDTRGSVLAFVGGFVLFTLVSAGLGGGG
jgi:zinc transporter, ZIP family